MNQDRVKTVAGKTDQGELIKYEIRKYAKYWLWFVIAVVVALILAFLYLRYTNNIYTSSSKLQILNKGKGLELPSAGFVFNRSSINLENEIEVLKSSRISERVANNLDLTMGYFEEGKVRTSELDRFPFSLTKTIPNDSITSFQSFKILPTERGFEVYRGNSEKALIFPNYSTYGVAHNLPFELEAGSLKNIRTNLGKTFIFKLIPIASASNRVRGRLSISVLGKTSDLLTLSFTGENRNRSERILNEVMEVFNRDGIRDRQEVSKRTINFIDERFALLAGELDSIEGEKRDYKQNNNFFTVEGDAALGISQRTQSENEVFNIESQILLSNMLVESLTQTEDNKELLPANIGISSGNVNALVESYNALIFERDEYLTSSGENNPMVVALNEKLAEVAKNIDRSLEVYKTQLEASKNLLVKRNRKFTAEASTIPKKEKIMRSIDRQQAIKETLFLFLLQKREEAAINLAITEPSIKVIEYAVSSGIPISPNPKNMYLMALAAGLLIPFGFIYVTILLDTKVKGKNDVKLRVDSVPILAELPRVKGDNHVFSDPTSRDAQAEAFRILSANVNYILPANGDGGKVIYVTSTIKGEGKTYVAVNLSLALASLNKKVLLIGADLRNPQIHHYTNPELDKNQIGLSNYLHDETFSWRDALVKGFPLHGTHDILVAGTIPPNPAHLLTNGRFEALLADAKNEYDFIIVDTAPTILVTDTLLISDLADATLYLVRAQVTEKNLLDFSKDLNDTRRLKNMAYIINGVGASKSYGYSYNYGYNYGYGGD